MKKNILKSSLLAAVVAGTAFIGQTAFAHGYVSAPASRSYQGMLDRKEGTPGWSGLYGGAAAEPQSMEGRKNFPEEGPADGTLPSGGLTRFAEMNKQSATMWKKQNIKSGVNTFTWTYTATHRTSKWTYWITKNGWNPNAPIKRSDLQLIGTVQGNGAQASTNLSHQINVPADHNGYHVILAVWDVYDTGGAFYQAIDVNVNGSSNTPSAPAAPAVPAGLKADHVTASTAKISWNAQVDAISYDVYRDGAKVATVNSPEFDDKGLKAGTTYSYQIVAKNVMGQTSAKSAKLSVKTSAATVVEKPTTPSGLHSMGQTESSVNLMWAASTHTQGIKGYQIFRNGVLIGESVKEAYMDTELTAGTEYRYTVKAVAKNGEVSAASAVLVVKTAAAEAPAPAPAEPQIPATPLNPATPVEPEAPSAPAANAWDAKKTYHNGDVVVYNGHTYKAKYWTLNNRPDQSAAWEQVVEKNSDGSVDYISGKAYVGGDIVKYNGRNYQAKWWTTSIPGSDNTWKAL